MVGPLEDRAISWLVVMGRDDWVAYTGCPLAVGP
jgi:hypothetical protein